MGRFRALWRGLKTQIGSCVRRNERLRANETQYRLLFEAMSEAVCVRELVYDIHGDPVNYRTLDVNPSFESIMQIRRADAIGTLGDKLYGTEEPYYLEQYARVATTGVPEHFETYFPPKDKHLDVSVFSHEPGRFVTVFRDVTEEKNKQRAIAYLSYHDSLTGLYNRRFFEEELARLNVERNLPLTVVMGDVNGLKLANDVFGHLLGDELLQQVAEVLRSVCRRDDIVARWGGDEFVMLLPHTGEGDAAAFIERIRAAGEGRRVGLLELSISLGSCTKLEAEQPFNDVLARAEDAMYRSKTEQNERQNKRLIGTLLQALFRQAPWEEGHSRRVCELSVRIAEAMGLPATRIEETRQVARLHDIGKVALSPELLGKPGELTEEDWKNLRRHAEVGYHILKANRDIAWMADSVLYHHERMDGSGYPRRLMGEEIPLLARIIAVADSYDTMCRGRYCAARSTADEALQELMRLAGSQYDGDVVQAFARKVLPQLINSGDGED